MTMQTPTEIELPDSVYVDGWVLVNPSRLDESVREVVERVDLFDLEKLNWCVGRWDFSPEDWRDRQRLLEEAFEEILGRVRAAGLVREWFHDDVAELAIYVGLTSRSGTASFALHADLLRPVLEWNGSVKLDAFKFFT